MHFVKALLDKNFDGSLPGERRIGDIREPARVHAGVRVKVTRKGNEVFLEIQEILLCKGDTMVVPLPDGCTVVSTTGEVCEPCGRFYVSTETFDPFHVVFDVF